MMETNVQSHRKSGMNFSFLFLGFICVYLMYMICLHVCKCTLFLLGIVVNYHVGAGNQTRVLSWSSQFSFPPSIFAAMIDANLNT